MGTMEIKYEQCKECLAYDQEWRTECEKCKDGSGYITIEDMLSDFDETPPKPEEEKLKYFPIRWLIRKIMKIESEYCCIWFDGIESRPKGRKQKIDGEYPLIMRILIPFVYVWQYRDGGYTGDDFAGNLYFPLLPFVWLRFGYEC